MHWPPEDVLLTSGTRMKGVARLVEATTSRLNTVEEVMATGQPDLLN